jgi:hypothetical protein
VGSRGIALLSRTSALDGVDRWLTPRFGRCTTGIDPVPLVLEAGRAPGAVWMGAENLDVTGIRSPDKIFIYETLLVCL